jgi:hypothetical protein
MGMNQTYSNKTKSGITRIATAGVTRNSARALEDNRHAQRQAHSTVAQLTAIPIAADKLTPNMKLRFDEAYSQFNGAILSGSQLATGQDNHVVIHGVSKASHNMKNYGSTTIYIGKDGYRGDEYDKFEEIWDAPGHKDIPDNVSVRVVITVNMTMNASIEELYATLLHEWYVHAAKWEDVVKAIRSGKGKDAVAEVQKEKSAPREAKEHIAYANLSNNHLEGMVNALGLKDQQKDKVFSKLKADRDRHDKITGDAK